MGRHTKDSTPTHTEPEKDRQPREHPVPCGKCGRLTLNYSALCGCNEWSGAQTLERANKKMPRRSRTNYGTQPTF